MQETPRHHQDLPLCPAAAMESDQRGTKAILCPDKAHRSEPSETSQEQGSSL